jgi:hypothetical protein
MAGTLALALAAPASAQSDVEMKTAPEKAPHFEIVPPGPAAREATKPPESDFYPEGLKVRQEPAFIEPFVMHTAGGDELGLAGWTTPEIPVGSLASQTYQQNNGWFGFGFTFIWNSAPRATTRPAQAPR